MPARRIRNETRTMAASLGRGRGLWVSNLCLSTPGEVGVYGENNL